jgi:hypothetical protein
MNKRYLDNVGGEKNWSEKKIVDSQKASLCTARMALQMTNPRAITNDVVNMY